MQPLAEVRTRLKARDITCNHVLTLSGAKRALVGRTNGHENKRALFLDITKVTDTYQEVRGSELHWRH